MTLMTLDTHDTLMVKPKNFKHFLTKSSKKNSIYMLKNSYLCSVERKMGKWAPGQQKFGFRPARIYYLPRA